ncbi:hypothetical protein DAPPUDRAFT_327748 [Daphnia pulex]|uniref:Uncharacterized protein n=1 Tax=Daphnia pulex TaxID=6669 RepID=E9HBM7_DAPPU|nr:hypothetical protein DAPPUDRAFT_327748 [Daphnia pulex]|eukprot:EFX70894.1 hypothetical protein DAPPUDRAFT_327748 [Daphnia pulex]
MKQMIIMIFFSLTNYVLMASAQQPTTLTNPYFYYHYNAPLALPGQMVSANEMVATKADLIQTHTEVENVKKELNELKENSQLNSSSTQLLANVMATVENMKKEMIKADETHTSRVESVKKELANVMTRVEYLKIDTDAN